MIQFLYGRDAEIAEFVAGRVPVSGSDFGKNFKAIGVIKNGVFVAGAVYHHWNREHETIAMSLAATNPRWMTRFALHRILDFPFNECGCQMLLAQVLASDFRTQHQLARAGFGFDKIRRIYGRHQDGIIATLTDDDWRASRFNRPPAEAKIEEAA